MRWNKEDYPPSFKNLRPQIREKAIEIANALIEDDYEEGRAISIALSKAREAVEGDDIKRQTYYVKKREKEKDWAFSTQEKENGPRPIFVEKRKTKLLEKAKPYVNKHNGVLKIYTEDGSLEKTLYE